MAMLHPAQNASQLTVDQFRIPAFKAKIEAKSARQLLIELITTGRYTGQPFRPKAVDEWQQVSEYSFDDWKKSNRDSGLHGYPACEKTVSIYRDPNNSLRSVHFYNDCNRVRAQYFHKVDNEDICHRIGAPACYTYIKGEGVLSDIQFFKRDRIYLPFDYYEEVSKQDCNSSNSTPYRNYFYYTEEIGGGKCADGWPNVIKTFLTHPDLPCPYQMYTASRQMKWLIDNEERQMNKYFFEKEQEFG